MFKNTVFYMRYSSDNQRQDSIVDQRRDIIQHLDRIGIDYEGAIELADEAISGTITKRPGFLKLVEMIDNGEVGLLIVDDLSRLTRGNDLGILWDKMALHGCRFISVLDGVDSIREGDEMGALVKGLMNNVTNKLHGKRVRRGIAGRALDKFGSAGYHPYGYATRYCDPEAALNYSGIGPKPKKEIFINEEEARHVREIFRLFAVEGWSISKTVRHLNSSNVPTGRRSKISTELGVRDNQVWNKTRVRRMLEQRKYIGDWRWGENICRKTDKGKVIKRPAAPHDVIRVENPDLAIISRDIWDKAQERLAALKEHRGFKFGQKKRGPKRHYTEDYPNDIVGGLLYCGVCGRRMYYVPKNARQQGPYFRCPNAVVSGKGEGGVKCAQRWFVRKDRVVEALSGYLKNYLLACDGWMDEVVAEVRNTCATHDASVPEETSRLRARRKEITSSIANLTLEIERGGGKAIPGALFDRIQVLETEAGNIDSKLRRLEALSQKEASFPSDKWIKDQMVDMAGVFEEDPQKTAKLFRHFFGKVYVRSVVAPGKSRGHSVISFTTNSNRLLTQIANLGEVPEMNAQASHNQVDKMVTIELSGHDKLDKLIPTIDAMRQAGKTWKDICAELGLAESWTNMYYNKWKKLTTVEASDAIPAYSLPDREIDSDAG